METTVTTVPSGTLPVLQTSNVVVEEQPIFIPSSPGVVTGPPLPTSGTFVSGYGAPLFPLNPLSKALETILSGGVPHNAELNEILALTKVAIGMSASEVGASERGLRIAADTQSILDTLARFLVVKNADEKFQRFIIHSGQLLSGTAKATMLSRRTTLPGSSQEGGEGTKSLSQIRSLFMFTLRSSEFRSIMKDAINLVQGLMGQGKQSKGDSQLASKLRDLAIKLSNNPEYKFVSETLLGAFASLKQGTYFARDALVQQDLLTIFDQMWDEATAIVQEFFGIEGPTMFSQALIKFYVTAYNDPTAMAVLREFRAYFEEAVRNPETLNDPAKKDYATQLINRARIILRSEPYKSQMRQILEGAKVMLHFLSNDPLSCELAANVAKLVADIGFDAQGRPDLFAISDSLNQIKLLIVPVIAKELSNFPIPRISTSDQKMELTIENILLEAKDIIPAIFDIEAKSRSRIAAYSISNQHFATILRITASGIKPYFNNVYFYFRRKVFPRISDEGMVKIDFTKGPGINLDIQWILESAGPDQPYELHLYKVKCRVANLKLKFDQTKYKFLENILARAFSTQIRRQIALSVVKKLTQVLEGINIKLNQILLKKPEVGLKNRLNESMKEMLKKRSKAEKKENLPKPQVTFVTPIVQTTTVSSVPSYVINDIKPLNIPTTSFQTPTAFTAM